MWRSDDSSQDRVLIEQTYPSIEDIDKHFYHLLPAFQDTRYLKLNNKPVFLIYKPLDLPEGYPIIKRWNELAVQEGFSGIYFIGHAICSEQIDAIIQLDFNAVNIERHGMYKFDKKIRLRWPVRSFLYKFCNFPLVLPYSFMIKHFLGKEEMRENIFPTLIPNWDHSPRSGRKGVVFHNSTPKLFKKHAIEVLRLVRTKKDSSQIVFLKSWNEWGEGNYMEPDLKFGKGYINALKEAIDCLCIKK